MRKDGQAIKLENQDILQFAKTNLIHINVTSQELNATNVLIESLCH